MLAKPARPRADASLGQAAALLAVVFGWLAFTAPAGGFEADIDHWIRWSYRIDQFGMSNAYGGLTGKANYLPMFIWVLAGLNRIVRGALTQDNAAQFVKIVALMFDFALGLAVARLLSARGRNPCLALLVAVNPATLYDSWVWGQIDAMHTALVAGSWIALTANRAPLAALLFLLALNTKLQSVIFVPFFVFALVHVIGGRWKTWAITVAACCGAQLALLAPFLNGRALRALSENVTGIVGYFNGVSLNAYNLWYLLADDPSQLKDTETFLHSTYRHWGMVLLAVALATIALPFARYVRRLWRSHALDRLDENGFLLLGVAGVAFFAFPTEVHERFLQPAVALIGIDAVLHGRYLAYAVLSSAYLLNLENVLRWRGLEYQGLLFDPRLVAASVLAIFVYGTWQAYQRTRAPLVEPGPEPEPT